MYTDENWSVKVPQLVTYHAMIDVAIERGLQVFVILTHLDNYHKSFDNIITRNYSDNRSLQDKRASEETEVLTSLEDIQNNENTSEDGRLGEDMLGELKGIYLQLSQRYIVVYMATKTLKVMECICVQSKLWG